VFWSPAFAVLHTVIVCSQRHRLLQMIPTKCTPKPTTHNNFSPGCKKGEFFYNMAMRIRWDEAKRQQVLQRRHIDLAQLTELFCLPYVEDQRNDDPEQYRLIGFVGGHLLTFIVEYREDALGEFIWVITAWHATSQEQRAYEREIR